MYVCGLCFFLVHLSSQYSCDCLMTYIYCIWGLNELNYVIFEFDVVNLKHYFNIVPIQQDSCVCAYVLCVTVIKGSRQVNLVGVLLIEDENVLYAQLIDTSHSTHLALDDVLHSSGCVKWLSLDFAHFTEWCQVQNPGSTNWQQNHPIVWETDLTD